MYFKADVKQLTLIFKSIEQVNKEILISYDEKVIISAFAGDTTVYLLTKIGKSFFTEISEWKGYYTFNLEAVTKRLKYFNKEVEIYVEENKLCLKENNTLFKLPLYDLPKDPKHRPFTITKPDAVYLLSPSVLTNAIDKAKMCAFAFKLIAKGKELIIETYDSNSYYKEILEVGEVANGIGLVKLGKDVLTKLNPIGKLTDQTILNLYNEKLLTVNVNAKNFSLNYMVAVRQDKE